VTRRIDDDTARKLALDECNRIVQRETGALRDRDRCSTYAIGGDVVWTSAVGAGATIEGSVPIEAEVVAG